MWMGSVSDFNSYAIVSSKNLLFCIYLLNVRVFPGISQGLLYSENSLLMPTLSEFRWSGSDGE